MLISAKIIKNPMQRICPTCNKAIDGAQLRLFGAAEVGDKPYAIHIHPECGWDDPKIVEALR